jgi:hypothetical protein
VSEFIVLTTKQQSSANKLLAKANTALIALAGILAGQAAEKRKTGRKPGRTPGRKAKSEKADKPVARRGRPPKAATPAAPEQPAADL